VGFDQSHGEEVIEFFITQSCPSDSASNPLCNPHAELVGDHSCQHQCLQMMSVAFAIESFAEDERLALRQ
jgi:hypothetical protein